MKLIYMEETIQELFKKGIEAGVLLKMGEVKKSEQGKNYLLIHIEDGDSTTHQEV